MTRMCLANLYAQTAAATIAYRTERGLRRPKRAMALKLDQRFSTALIEIVRARERGKKISCHKQRG